MLGLLLLTSTQAATNYWTGGGGEGNQNWSNAANWSSNSVPDAVTDVFFGTDGASESLGQPNNTVDTSATILSVRYLNTNNTTYHTTLLNPGTTLLVSNTVNNAVVFAGGGRIDPPLVLSSHVQGPGAGISIVASNGILSVGQARVANTSGSPKYSLDMYEVDSLAAYLSRFYVAGDSTYRVSGALYLPKTNLIVLGYTSGPPLLLGNCNTGGAGGELYLGWTNAVFGDVGMWVGYRRTSASKLAFHPYIYGGAAYFRNRAGTGRQNYWRIGDGSTQTYSGNACNGNVDFSLGTVDAMIGELVVARNMTTGGNPSLPQGGAIGTLTFNAGTIDVNNVIVGYQMVDNGPQVSGTINVDGTGQLVVNNSMQLGRFMANTNVANVGFAKLNIGTITGGGSVVVNSGITTSTNAENPNRSEIHIQNGGSLSVNGTVGPLNFLDLSTGTLTLNLDSHSPTAVCTASTLQIYAGFNLTITGPTLETGQTPLFKYETLYSNGADDLALTLPVYLEGYLSNNTANSSIDLVITNKLVTVWNGNLSDDWNIATTANWKDGTTGTSKTYGQTTVPGDIVRFDDSAQGSGNVNLTTDLAPFAISVNNSTKAYTFTGTGRLTGPTGLAKHGSSTLTVANNGANDFTGPITVDGGTLQLGGSADRLPTTATVTLANTTGVSLDLNNLDQSLDHVTGGGSSGGNIALGTGTLSITGSGTYDGVISGTGKLVKTNSGTLTLSGANLYSGGTVIHSNSTITVANGTGDGLGSGPVHIEGGILRIGTGGTAGSLGGNDVDNNGALFFNRSDDLTFANLITGTGGITKQAANVVTLPTANEYTGVTAISAGALRVAHSSALGSPVSPDSDYSTSIPATAGAHLQLANNVTLDETIQFSCKTGSLLTQPGILSVSGTNTLNGPIILNSGGSVHNFSADAGSKLIVNSTFTPSAGWAAGWPYHGLGGEGEGEINSGFINGSSYNNMTNNLYKVGNGTWTLNGTNLYAGFTVISNGTLVVNGSILGTNLGPMPAGFWVGCQVRSEGTLKGNGLINCVVTNAGALSPGSSIGTLTISNSLVLLPGSINLFEIEGSQHDQIRGLTTVIYGGTLKINLTGTLAGGEVFQLFSADAYSANNFDSFDLPVPPDGLEWDTTQLTVDGTLRVTGGGAIEISQVSLASDGNFQLSGSYGTGNAGYHVLATTNVADPESWVDAGSGNFTAGDFSFTDLVSTNYPRRFYRVVTP